MMLWVALGAALGSGLRATLWLALPLHGTVLANGLGSLLAGALAAQGLSLRARSFAITGFCGGFTTFSLFGLETLIFLQAAAYLPAFLYVSATLLLSLGGAALGLSLGKRFHRGPNTPPG